MITPATHSKAFQTVSGQVEQLQSCEVFHRISETSNLLVICSG